MNFKYTGTAETPPSPHYLLRYQQRRQLAADRQCRGRVRLFEPDIGRNDPPARSKARAGSNSARKRSPSAVTACRPRSAGSWRTAAPAAAPAARWQDRNRQPDIDGTSTYTGGTTITGGGLYLGDSVGTGKILNAVAVGASGTFRSRITPTPAASPASRRRRHELRNSTSAGSAAITDTTGMHEFLRHQHGRQRHHHQQQRRRHLFSRWQQRRQCAADRQCRRRV